MKIRNALLKGIGLILVCTTGLSALQAQNNTKTPVSRYGYGQIADRSFASQRAMGGIGYGVSNSQLINPLNPASFSGVDSMTFMLDIGVFGQTGWIKDGQNQAKRSNAGFEYLAIQFPLAKKLGMGIGLEPLSYVGYQYQNTDSMNFYEGTEYSRFTGKGGLNRIYADLSYKINERFSVGVSLGYLFGDVIHNRTSYFSNSSIYSTSWIDTLRASGLTYDFGIQYHHPVGKNSELVLGLVYTPKTKFTGNVMWSELQVNSSSQITKDSLSVDNHQGFQLPETYAFGLSYHQFDKLLVGADFQYQRWADAKFHNKKDSLTNRLKINVGMEWIPNYMGYHIYDRIRYRLGAHYADSYIVDVNGSKYKEYGVSLGFGIPMVDRRSFVNLAFEYNRIQPSKPESIDEQYFKLTLSYTFNELWFFKRKLQ